MSRGSPPSPPALPSGLALRGWFALGLAVLLATSACGFKLRGDLGLPPELSPLFIRSPPGSQVRDPLIQQLRETQLRLATTPKQARTLIRIRNERRSSRVLSVDENGKVLAYELHYGLIFDAMTADSKQLIAQQSLNLVRSYNNPGQEVLGKQLETDLIHADMLTDAARRILERLRAALLRRSTGKRGSVSDERSATTPA